MSDWERLVSLIEFSTVYYTTQLVRCALFSFVLIWLVMLLRRFFSKHTFLRGLLWLSFLVIPFLGRLKMFYENEAVLRMTWRITQRTMTCLWADRIYMAGVFVSAVCIFRKRLRLGRAAAGMETVSFYGLSVRVTDMKVTPFTFGLLKPEIVIPRIILDSYGRDELRILVQHEQTHIRLGHLWIGFAWEILRCLLWVNPFLAVFQKQFRSDLEDICDRVCIQRTGSTAYEYGLLLLKTIRLLQAGPDGTPSAAAYAGEREFADMKRRISKIAGFRPYKKRLCKGMTAAAVFTVSAMLLTVHAHSYARSIVSRDILVGNDDGKPEVISADTGKLAQMISYDDRYVYVQREAFERFLEENNAEGEIWIVFGGFYKLPGLAGVSEACIYEKHSKDRIVQIPYESIMDHWYLDLLKLL